VAAVRDALSIGVVVGMVLILAIAAWSCVPSRRRAKEEALRERLASLRSVIAQYRGDQRRAPQSLEDLVHSGYLRSIPLDPITGSRLSWIEVRTIACSRASLSNVRSGAPGRALDGSEYRAW